MSYYQTITKAFWGVRSIAPNPCSTPILGHVSSRSNILPTYLLTANREDYQKMVQPSQLSLMQHQKVHQFSFIPHHHCQYLCPGRVAVEKGGCSLRRCYLSNVHVNVRSFHDPLKTHRISLLLSQKYFGTSFKQFRSRTSKSQ